MKGALIRIDGNWAHFKKPETNNNPLTHDFITKTALIGLIGAVLGIERTEMKELFPQLSEDLRYGVSVQNPVKKQSWSFTLRRASNLFEKAPKQMEFLKNPLFIVALALQNERSEELFSDFINALQNNESAYTPVLGLHNCPANLELISTGDFKTQEGEFITSGFVLKTQKPRPHQGVITRLGFERIPTFQNNDFWNMPDKYAEIIYPSENHTIRAEGQFYQYSDNNSWAMV